jgi:GTP-binding protein HflX
VIRHRLMQIRRELDHVRVHRRVQREGRRRAGVPVAALVGYTNAGKTTLLNRLSGASLVAADRLFVTLDPAARLVNGDGRRPFILTDTVGFIRKLPHELVAAFRATLEELQDADVLVHVVDASHPALDEHMAAVEALLGELGVADRPTVLALNKIDRVEEPRVLSRLVDERGGVPISAATGEGLDRLRAVVEAALRPAAGAVRLRVPHADAGALARCYAQGRVLKRVDDAEHVELEVELPPSVERSLAAYQVARVH